MGGSLAVTIVDPEGTWHKMDRWTNPTSWYFTDTRFLNGDPVLLREYLDTWYEMCQEYDDFHGGVGGAPEPRMATCYCNPDYSSRDLVAPSEYGLVYLDMPNKRFWHMQGYSTYHQISVTRIILDERDWDTTDPEEVAGERAHYESLLPRITIHRTPTDRDTDVDVPVSFASVEDLINHAFQMNKRRDAKGMSDWSYYVLDMTGWDYRVFPDDRDGAVQFQAALVETGYEFSEKELKHWDDFRKLDEDDED